MSDMKNWFRFGIENERKMGEFGDICMLNVLSKYGWYLWIIDDWLKSSRGWSRCIGVV
jgi:hypothetical protein